jgi:hypothetical protein
MNTVDRAKQALWMKSGLLHDANGYVEDRQMNFIPSVTTEMVKDDYDNGDGQEWSCKIRAIHSSAALAANTFGKWKNQPSDLSLLNMSGFDILKFEAKCPTGLGGTPPNLDVLLQSQDTVIGIESKLLEPLKQRKPHFSTSYTRNNLPLCEDAWWNLLLRVQKWPPSHLDAAQLIKHYLGLRKKLADGKKVFLLYLFWIPLNANKFTEYDQHTKELEEFRSSVQDVGAVQFVAMDYLQLWNSWESDKLIAEHARLLKNRYCVEI